MANSAFSAQSASAAASCSRRRWISFFSVMVRTAAERTSTSVSSISWIISFTIFSGSSAWSRSELMLAFTMSVRREKMPMMDVSFGEMTEATRGMRERRLEQDRAEHQAGEEEAPVGGGAAAEITADAVHQRVGLIGETVVAVVAGLVGHGALQMEDGHVKAGVVPVP